MRTPPLASIEMELLLALLRHGDNVREASLLALHCSDAGRWSQFVQATQRHGVTLQAAERLRALKLTSLLPSNVATEFALCTREWSVRAMSQVGALREIQAAMDDEGIALVTWKGPALAKHLHGSIGRRSSGDLDFLLRRRDMPATIRRLESLGYVTTSPWQTREAVERAAHMNCEVQLVRARDGVRLELHDEVMPRLFGPGLSIESCIERAGWVELDAHCRVKMLAPHELLISLAAHGAKHGWECLKWVMDIAALVVRRGNEFDWPVLLEEARKASALGAVLGAIRLAEKLLGVPQPETVRTYAWRRASIEETVRSAAEGILKGNAQVRTVDETLRDALSVAGTPTARIGYLVRRIVTPNALDVERFPLPPALSALQAPLRLLRLTASAVRPSAGRTAGTENPRGDA